MAAVSSSRGGTCPLADKNLSLLQRHADDLSTACCWSAGMLDLKRLASSAHLQPVCGILSAPGQVQLGLLGLQVCHDHVRHVLHQQADALTADSWLQPALGCLPKQHLPEHYLASLLAIQHLAERWSCRAQSEHQADQCRASTEGLAKPGYDRPLPDGMHHMHVPPT